VERSGGAQATVWSAVVVVRSPTTNTCPPLPCCAVIRAVGRIGTITTGVCRRSLAIHRSRDKQCGACVCVYVCARGVGTMGCRGVMSAELSARSFSMCCQPTEFIDPLLQENICLLYRFRSAALYALWNTRIKAGDDPREALNAARAARCVSSPHRVRSS
jgi:hypothetical protein